jgi:hypothetical protein
MTISKSLPDRPSLESLRKQAKKLAREIAAGDSAAISRARVQLPNIDLPMTQRNAQFVIAREYGFAGWQDLTAEVSKRLGNEHEWAVAQARRAIHDNDVERLKQLLAEYPTLLSWQGRKDRGLLGIATGAYGDSFEAAREKYFTRAECAELLLDAGAIVMPSVFDGLLESRVRGLLEMFRRRSLLPRTLKFFAALGDLDGVRTVLDQNENDLTSINEAFMRACAFQHDAVASILLDRLIELDAELGKHIDDSVGRHAFIKYLMEERSLHFAHAKPDGPWQAFLMEQVMRALQHGDLPAFVSGLEREPWLLGEDFALFQADLIGTATLQDREEFILALFDSDPAILRHQPPPESQAIEFAMQYAHTHLIPLLTRIWPVPDDLPHQAGMGNLARVKEWFDESGAPALGDLNNHYPYNDPRARSHLQWDPPTLQQVLDVALAYSVTNRHLDIAAFLLDHGADINTNWNSHEPASLLHHLVFVHRDHEAMKFLIDRGIDMTIKDYRWNGTAKGWALYAMNDEKLANWLDKEEREREQGQ